MNFVVLKGRVPRQFLMSLPNFVVERVEFSRMWFSRTLHEFNLHHTIPKYIKNFELDDFFTNSCEETQRLDKIFLSFKIFENLGVINSF